LQSRSVCVAKVVRWRKTTLEEPQGSEDSVSQVIAVVAGCSGLQWAALKSPLLTRASGSPKTDTRRTAAAHVSAPADHFMREVLVLLNKENTQQLSQPRAVTGGVGVSARPSPPLRLVEGSRTGSYSFGGRPPDVTDRRPS